MKKFLFFTFILFFSTKAYTESHIYLTQKDNLFVRISVPKKGIVCSNQNRAERISKILEKVSVYEIPWGPKIYIGHYKGNPLFIASAPVGSGSGLMFTELYSAGAEYIIRYGSDDVKSPDSNEESLVKIISEADNLYGFNIQSGVDPKEWGGSVFASEKILIALKEEAQSRNLKVEERICHHLENYHGLRTPEKFSKERKERIIDQLNKIKRTDKKESFDMETAVLFRVAKDFDKHAASVLQTVNKESSKLGPYEGRNKEQALHMEAIFLDYILAALLRINDADLSDAKSR